MQTISLILLLVFTALQRVEEPNFENFVRLQINKYQVVQLEDRNGLANCIEKQSLHFRKREMALKAKTSHVNSYNMTVYTHIQLYEFNFTTNQGCRQAVDSLLRYFPFDGGPVTRHRDQLVKMTPAILIFNQNSINIAVTDCEQADKQWTRFTKDFAQAIADDDSEIIIAQCGYLTWTNKEKIKNAP